MSNENKMESKAIFIVIILLLSLALLLCIYLLSRKPIANFQGGGTQVEKFIPALPKFKDPVPDDDARKYIEAFRNVARGADTTHVITYLPETISKYMNETWPTLIAGYRIDDYHWEVGFYTCYRPDAKGDPRLDFLVIPTLVKGETKLDFYSDYAEYQERKPKVPTSLKPPADGFGYDTGHLWP